ncbi:YlxR family protein [Nocardioides massiliensis]|uniref:YlxR family protein n=1 Tax=Nocardioides massiliensis TaxID=1325935 RepID=UPI000A7FA4EB|nr:YlxR family protein [Nocardioides massiliensis]
MGCRQRVTKTALVRVVVGAGDRGPAAVPDPAGTAPGRGAHLHPDPACLDLAVRRKAFPRALRAPGGLDLAPLTTYLTAKRSEADTVRQTD